MLHYTEEKYEGLVQRVFSISGLEAKDGSWDLCFDKLKTALLQRLGKVEVGVRVSQPEAGKELFSLKSFGGQEALEEFAALVVEGRVFCTGLQRAWEVLGSAVAQFLARFGGKFHPRHLCDCYEVAGIDTYTGLVQGCQASHGRASSEASLCRFQFCLFHHSFHQQA